MARFRIMPRHTGCDEPLIGPKGTTTQVGLKDPKIKARAWAGEMFKMRAKSRPMPLPPRGGSKNHQAKIGIFGQRKAKRQFGHTGQVAVQKKPQPMGTRRIAAGWGGGEHLVNLVWAGILAKPQVIVVGGLHQQRRDGCAVVLRI